MNKLFGLNWKIQIRTNNFSKFFSTNSEKHVKMTKIEIKLTNLDIIQL